MDGYYEEKIKDISIIKVDRPDTSSIDAGSFKDYLLNLVFKGRKKIVIDVCSVEHLDSAFLGALLISKQFLEASNIDFNVLSSGDNGYVWSILKNSPIYEKLRSRDEFMKTIDTSFDSR